MDWQYLLLSQVFSSADIYLLNAPESPKPMTAALTRYGKPNAAKRPW
jgi:hypothetical protein